MFCKKRNEVEIRKAGSYFALVKRVCVDSGLCSAVGLTDGETEVLSDKIPLCDDGFDS